jgi:hypothetical protein
LVPGSAVPKSGFLEASDAPGFGIEVREDRITDWTAKPIAKGDSFY